LSPAVKKEKRTIRLIRLTQLVQSGPGRNASDLAKACKVDRRTIFRDLAALRESGLPIEFDEETKRYSARGWALPPVQLTPDEALALFGLATEFGWRKKLPFYDAAYNAARKIEQTLSKQLRRSVASIARVIDIHSVELNRRVGTKTIFSQLIDAIVKRRVVNITYGSLTECETIKTELQPYHLLFTQHCWYVLGHSSMHGEVRTFNLDRFKSFELLTKRYTFPRSFSLDRHLGNAWHMIHENGPDSHVVVRFSPFVAQNVAEVQWHKTQRTTMLPDGHLEFRATVSGLSEICWWILRYGDQAEVLKPARLRRMIAQRAKNMAAIYKESD
jgi:predicted DNA-binding transcriptional regulator YafY